MPWTDKELRQLYDLYHSKPRPKYAVIAQILGKTSDSVRNQIWKLRKKDRHRWLEEERIGFFDIETTNLKANLGNMISWAMKPLGGETIFHCWTRREAITWDRMDKRIMRLLIKELQNYDLIVTYFGTRFDIGFIRTRAMILGLRGFPEFGALRHFDLYYAVRNKMSLHSNRLAVATQTLGIDGKTPLPPSVWGRGRLGYEDALEEIEEHNIADVEILEDLYLEMVPYVQITRKSI